MVSIKKNGYKIIGFILATTCCLISPLFGASPHPVNVKWVSQLKGGLSEGKRNLNFSTPLVAGEKVYAGNDSGFFYCNDLVKGKKLWRIKLEGAVLSKPSFDGGVVFVGDGKGQVYSINADSGLVNWHAYIGEELMTTPAIDENNVYVSTENNSVVAIDRASGSIKWTAKRQQPFSSLAIKGHSSPIIIDDKIYVGDTDGVVVVYNKGTGQKVATWPVATGRGQFTDIDTTLLRDNGLVLFSSMEGGLYAVDYKSGDEKWSLPIGTPNNLVYDGGNLYVSVGGKVVALGIDKGDKLWESTVDESELSEPVAGKNFIAVASTANKIYLLDKTNGKIVYSRYIGGGAFGSPVIAGDRLLILSNSNQLYAFKIRD